MLCYTSGPRITIFVSLHTASDPTLFPGVWVCESKLRTGNFFLHKHQNNLFCRLNTCVSHFVKHGVNQGEQCPPFPVTLWPQHSIMKGHHWLADEILQLDMAKIKLSLSLWVLSLRLLTIGDLVPLLLKVA